MTDALHADLVRPCDIRGLLHAHTRNVDGVHSMTRMVETAISLGLDYLGISDHFCSSIHPEGLDLEGEEIQREEIEAVRRAFPDFELLHGVELNAFEDGSLPLDDEDLASFDYVLVSLAGWQDQDIAANTRAALRVIEHPFVSVVSKPLGELMVRRPPVAVDMDRILRAAAACGTVVEMDAHPCCPEIDLAHLHLAREHRTRLAINTDAHRAARLVDFLQGVQIARDAGLPSACLVNTMSAVDVRRLFTVKRTRLQGDYQCL